MAIGASAARVVREVAGDGVRLCAYGLVGGVIAAWLLGEVCQRFCTACAVTIPSSLPASR